MAGAEERARRPLADPVPRAWLEALDLRNQDRSLLALAEGAASFAVPDPEADPDFARGAFLLALLVLVSEGGGSTGLALAEGLAELAPAFGADPERLRGLLADPRLEPLLGRPGGPRRPLVLDGGMVYSERLHRAETRFAGRIRARLERPGQDAPALDGDLLAGPRPPSGEQQEAVRAALGRPLTLVTGGPGTGKTTVVVTLLRAALRAGTAPGRILLAAPTGKAANRMAESLRDAGLPADLPAPQTLHRLLGYLPGRERFRRHAGNPLEADLVVVDEASMIDLPLMDQLVQAVVPEARLVFLGDEDQLPSVGPGRVFQDLLAALPGSCRRLTRNFRMGGAGGAVLQVSRDLLRFPAADPFAGPEGIRIRSGAGDFQGQGVELADLDRAGMEAFLARWLDEQVEGGGALEPRIRRTFAWREEGWDARDQAVLEELFAAMDRARILCPLREAPDLRGVRPINAFLHGLAQRRRHQDVRAGLAFALGEPVLMTRNDYRRGIFNGDQGLMLLVARGDARPRLLPVFPAPDGFRAFPLEPLLGALELAYAVTVHKAQGAEFQEVALVLPELDTPLLSRELVYTAVTRARRSVRVIGSRERLEAAAGATLARQSGLGPRLESAVRNSTGG